jgi:hypothetical protein
MCFGRHFHGKRRTLGANNSAYLRSSLRWAGSSWCGLGAIPSLLAYSVAMRNPARVVVKNIKTRIVELTSTPASPMLPQIHTVHVPTRIDGTVRQLQRF